MILFFSGTGNSKYAAERIASAAEDTVFSINDSMKKATGETITSETPLVFITPTYAWRIPRVVEEWIENTRFSGNKKAYFVMTCGGDNGNAAKYIKRLCQKKNFDYMGCAEIVMPENYITLFQAPAREDAIALIHQADPIINQISQTIKKCERLPEKKIVGKDHVSSGFINTIFYPLFVSAKKYYTTDACVGCGICEKKCPLNNIKLKDGKPVWGNHCTQCMACICGCPKEAIEYGKKSHGKIRYRFPV